MSKKKKYCSKKWIDPSTTGFIQTEVEFGYSWGATFKMADCSRIINLDVYIDDEKSRKKTLKKLNIIRDEVTNLISAIEDINYE